MGVEKSPLHPNNIAEENRIAKPALRILFLRIFGPFLSATNLDELVTFLQGIYSS